MYSNKFIENCINELNIFSTRFSQFCKGQFPIFHSETDVFICNRFLGDREGQFSVVIFVDLFCNFVAKNTLLSFFCTLRVNFWIGLYTKRAILSKEMFLCTLYLLTLLKSVFLKKIHAKTDGPRNLQKGPPCLM